MPDVISLQVLEHKETAKEHWEMLFAPHPAFEHAVPGQFVNVLCRPTALVDPLLRRPFSIYRREEDGAFSILYRVVGRGTDQLKEVKAGDKVSVVGPLGQGFYFDDLGPKDRVAIVGGGVGVPPLYFLSQALEARGIPFEVLAGFAHHEQMVAVSRWRSRGVSVGVTTDDGSYGKRGFVTDLLEDLLETKAVARVFSCGPRPMLQVVASLCKRAGVSLQVAMEEEMGCGVGVCLSCIVSVKAESADGEVDSGKLASGSPDDFVQVRVCREGPVLDGLKVIWHHGR